MNSRAWQELARAYVVDRVQGLVLTRSLLHVPDTTWLLRGVAMVASADSESFTLWAFVQPLYVPANRLVFRFGRQLTRVAGQETSWPALPVAALGHEIATVLRSQALPLVIGVSSPADLLAVIRREPDSALDPALLEAGTYSAILAEDVTAVRLFSRQMRDVRPVAAPAAELVRLRRVLAGYERDAASTIAQLRAWRDETARELRVPRLGGPVDLPNWRRSDTPDDSMH